jgi:hypothetical protein
VLVGRPVPGQVVLPLAVPAFTRLNGSDVPQADADTEVALLSTSGPATSGLTGGGDAGDLEDAADVVRVVTAPHHPHLLWVQEHLQHLSSHASAIAAPAAHVAEQRRVPWWR